MNYLHCIKNQAYVREPDASDHGEISDLTLGAVYKALPTLSHESEAGLVRIIDNSGEDYLYPASYFQPVDWDTVPVEKASHDTSLTVHLDPLTKAILRAEAIATHRSMGSLVRQWIKERLELPASPRSMAHEMGNEDRTYQR
ncbi:ribbon-helix-helix protein, CopG family [Candidatus Entotheonella palauensis]|uniref:Uncharacterized protein n=1 Tax=Candidatus Entotheonella gemina TaxID=1429439 RepID=W4M8Y6_9BACT|nr:ribbon-helix-helix protein, CopG family [Candidatus Entotheonella palauensis]ETX06376.1 MAG: hypothetical protein ETSY2_17485 [Candidatus Entotheonella gemina]